MPTRSAEIIFLLNERLKLQRELLNNHDNNSQIIL